PRGERPLALDRAVHLILDGAVDVEALAPAPSAVVERVASGGDRLRPARLEQPFPERSDLARHDAEQVRLEWHAEREREPPASIEDHLRLPPPRLLVPGELRIREALGHARLSDPQRVVRAERGHRTYVAELSDRRVPTLDGDRWCFQCPRSTTRHR